MSGASVTEIQRSAAERVRADERFAVRVPPGYFLDCSDPDILVLCRRDGSFLAAFSARGVTREGITEALEAAHAESR
jgi:hypothetical protein